MSAASEAKIPAKPARPTKSHRSIGPQNSHEKKKDGGYSPNLRAPALTWKVVEEGDLDGAANDRVHPEPPSSPEDGAGHARTDDPPKQSKVLHGRDLSSPTPPTKQSPRRVVPPFSLLRRIVFSQAETGAVEPEGGCSNTGPNNFRPIKKAQLGISLGLLRNACLWA